MASSSPAPTKILYETRPSRISGEGLFATSSIPQGTIIVSEPPLITIPPLPVSHDPSLNNHSVVDAFSQLSTAQQELYLHLHPSSDNDDISIIDRFEKNCFNCDELAGMTQPSDPKVSGVFLVTSKINHSCQPNVDWDTKGDRGEVVALRDVDEGEELVMDYVDEVAAWDTRRRKLTRGWGIVCDCPGCLMGEEEAERREDGLDEGDGVAEDWNRGVAEERVEKGVVLG